MSVFLLVFGCQSVDTNPGVLANPKDLSGSRSHLSFDDQQAMTLTGSIAVSAFARAGSFQLDDEDYTSTDSSALSLEIPMTSDGADGHEVWGEMGSNNASDFAFVGADFSFSTPLASAAASSDGNVVVSMSAQPDQLAASVGWIAPMMASVDEDADACDVDPPKACGARAHASLTSDVQIHIPFHVSQPTEVLLQASKSPVASCGLELNLEAAVAGHEVEVEDGQAVEVVFLDTVGTHYFTLHAGITGVGARASTEDQMRRFEACIANAGVAGSVSITPSDQPNTDGLVPGR